MGWINYLIIKDWKIAIEVPRSVEGLDDWEREAMDKALEFDCDKQELFSRGIMQVDVKDLKVMAEAVDIISNFSDMSPVKFLLYWLEQKGIKYKIKSEFDFDAEKSKLLIVRM